MSVVRSELFSEGIALAQQPLARVAILIWHVGIGVHPVADFGGQHPPVAVAADGATRELAAAQGVNVRSVDKVTPFSRAKSTMRIDSMASV